jgi:hypothetical protein
MPDVTSVLERAAAAPTRSPDIETPARRSRRRRVMRASAAVAVVAAVVIGVLAVGNTQSSHVRVTGPPPVPQPITMTSHDASIDVTPGWSTSTEPLEWWLISPFELFSIATFPLPPSRHDVPNDAACPSEIPAAAVDNLPADGAYLWIGEWVPNEGLYQTAPRPVSFSGVALNPACPLPRGEQAFSSIYRDGARDFTVTYVLGPDAPTSRRDAIDQMLNSLRFH